MAFPILSHCLKTLQTERISKYLNLYIMAEIQLLGTGLVMGSGKEGDSGVRNHKALQVASEVRETLD